MDATSHSGKVSKVSPTIKDSLEIQAWILAIAGAGYGIQSGIAESRSNRRLEQAEMARQVLEKISDNYLARSAMRMLDWDGRKYDLTPQRKVTVSTSEMTKALRTDTLVSTDKEQFFRDCFDELFDGYERVEHYIRIKLIRFDDVRDFVFYYATRLKDHNAVLDNYLANTSSILPSPYSHASDAKPGAARPASRPNRVTVKH